MKIDLKIDPDHFPILIIALFVIGFVISMALGFRPDYGSHGRGHGVLPPALVCSHPAWDDEAI